MKRKNRIWEEWRHYFALLRDLLFRIRANHRKEEKEEKAGGEFTELESTEPGPLLDALDHDEVQKIYRAIEKLKKELAAESKKAAAPKKHKKEKAERKPPEEVKIEEKLAAIEQIFASGETQKKQYMIYVVCYDITENRLRLKIAEYLEARNFHRVQKSVFIGNIHRKHLDLLVRALDAIKIKFEDNDSILIIPVSESNFQQMIIMGRKLYLEKTLKREKVLLF